jgi:hypothetical protein
VVEVTAYYKGDKYGTLTVVVVGFMVVTIRGVENGMHELGMSAVLVWGEVVK